MKLRIRNQLQNFSQLLIIIKFFLIIIIINSYAQKKSRAINFFLKKKKKKNIFLLWGFSPLFIHLLIYFSFFYFPSIIYRIEDTIIIHLFE